MATQFAIMSSIELQRIVFLSFVSDARTHVPRSRHVESLYFRRLPCPSPAGVDNVLSSAHCSSMLMRYLTNRTVARGVDLIYIFSVPSKYFEGPQDILAPSKASSNRNVHSWQIFTNYFPCWFVCTSEQVL